MSKTASKYKKLIGLVIRITIGALGILWAYSRIDMQVLSEILAHFNLWWMIPTILLHALSKAVSSVRLTYFLNQTGVKLSQWEGIRLYWIGMFYNLFLPGGIGGDAYKVVLLNKYRQAPWKRTTGTVLYDRLSGMMVLTMFSGLFIPFIFPEYWYFAIIVFGGSILIGYILTRIFFKSLSVIFIQGTILSFGVQGLQIILAWVLFLGLLNTPVHPGYIFLFLVSSVVSVLPISIGGIGAREFAFVWGASQLDISSESGVVFSLLFFITTALASLPGGFIRSKNAFKGSD